LIAPITVGDHIASNVSWCVPFWNGIVFGEPTEELAAGVFIEDRVEELVRAIDDIDHQLFHFLIIEAGDTGPRNRAEWAGDRHVRLIAGGG
jgi:hypothetical protein